MKSTQDFTREVFRRAAERRERSRHIRATVIPLAAALVIAGVGGAAWLGRPGLTVIDALASSPTSEIANGEEDTHPTGNSTTATNITEGSLPAAGSTTAGSDRSASSRKGAPTTTVAATSGTQAACFTQKEVMYYEVTVTGRDGDTVTVKLDYNAREYTFTLRNIPGAEVKVGDRIRIGCKEELVKSDASRITVYQWQIIEQNEN